VVTSTLVMEGEGRVGEYVGGYEDWRRQTAARQLRAAKPVRAGTPKAQPAAGRKKLSYRDRQDLEALPGRIEALETEQQALHASLADPALYRDAPRVVSVRARLAEVERELATAFERWEALSEAE
jgi:ATP-binding cassette subfamily F protein uup